MALFGIATLLADAHPKAVGIRMLVTASVLPTFFIVLSSLPAFIGNTVNLVVYLGIGIVLLNDGSQPTGLHHRPTHPHDRAETRRVSPPPLEGRNNQSAGLLADNSSRQASVAHGHPG